MLYLSSPTSLQARVRWRLVWLGLRQRDLAQAIGMDPTCLSRSLRATRPRRQTLARIAWGLGLSVEDLLSSDSTCLEKAHPASSHVFLHETYGSGSIPSNVEILTEWLRRNPL